MCGWLVRILTIALFVAPLHAQEKLLPLADVVRLVAQRDPGIKARAAEDQAARTEVRRVETRRLPKLYINADAGAGKLINDVANVLLTGLTPVAVTDLKTRSRLADLSSTRPFVLPTARVEDELFDGGQTSAAVRSARLNETKAEVAQSRGLDDEAYATASDFLNAAYDRVLARHLEEYAQVAQTAASALASQAKEGRITDAQALAGQAKSETAQTDLANNRDDLLVASDLLRQRAALPSDAAFDTQWLENSLADPGLAPMPAEAGLDQNADLRNSLLDTRISQEEVRAAKARRAPELKFEAEYGFTFSAEIFSLRPSYTVGVTANYPLFTSRELERNIQEQTLRLDAAKLKQEKTAASIHEEQTRLMADSRKLARQYQAARSQLAQAEEVYRVARLKYDQGAGSPADLLESAELLFASRQRCLDIARSSWLLRWNAFRLQGRLVAELERAQP